MKVNINIKYKGKFKIVELTKTGFFRRGLGLMFRTRETDNLLFSFDKPCRVAITSWFVFFPFLAIWLDNKNSVVDMKVAKPFELAFRPKKPAKSLVELPLNAKNRDLIAFFVGK